MTSYTPARRQMITGAVAALFTVTIPSLNAAGDDITHDEEAIHQEPLFKANRKRVYEALTETRPFSKLVELSGAMQSMPAGSKAAEISGSVGGPFTIFGGHIVGRQLELVPGERIVQAWRVVDWRAGVYSIVRFELTSSGQDTKLIFDHTGFPRGAAAHLASGWEEHYWTPLRKYLV